MQEGSGVDNYYWAAGLCETFKVDLSAVPEISDWYEREGEYDYQCTFSDADRELSVHGWDFKQVDLRFKLAVAEEKDKAVEKILRKLQIEEIRPY